VIVVALFCFKILANGIHEETQVSFIHRYTLKDSMINCDFPPIDLRLFVSSSPPAGAFAADIRQCLDCLV
jgi:hypothetical protein